MLSILIYLYLSLSTPINHYLSYSILICLYLPLSLYMYLYLCRYHYLSLYALIYTLLSIYIPLFILTSIYRVVQVNPAFFYFQFWQGKHYSINMGILPVVIYVISDLEPKFHWDGMKNEWATYNHIHMGHFQLRRRPM